MPEWSVRLIGHAFDLDELCKHFLSPERNVKKDKDGYYYLRSTDFDSMADEQAVRERALELVERMNWAAKFHLGNGYQPVELDVVTRVDESGKRMHHIALASQLVARSRVSASLTTIGEDDSPGAPRPPSEAESMVTLAEGDERVADALRFFAGGDWVNLYKAWEIVRDSSGGEHALLDKGWTTKKTKNRFTQTAQSREALGDEARHASEKYEAPENPMSIDEAQAFVKSMIEAWTKTL